MPISSSASLAKRMSISSGLSTPIRLLSEERALVFCISTACSPELLATTRSSMASKARITARSSGESSSDESKEKDFSSMSWSPSYLFYQSSQQRRNIKYGHMKIYSVENLGIPRGYQAGRVGEGRNLRKLDSAGQTNRRNKQTHGPAC